MMLTFADIRVSWLLFACCPFIIMPVAIVADHHQQISSESLRSHQYSRTNQHDFFDIHEGADLSIAVFDSPDPCRVGDDLIYDIIVTNAGPQSSGDFVITNQYSPHVILKSITAPERSWTHNNGVIRFELTSLAPGTSTSVQFTVQTGLAMTLTNHAFIASPMPDPDQTNNQVTVSTHVHDDGGTIAFGSASLLVYESPSNLLVLVTRSERTNGAVAVDYSTEDVSALGGDDYQQQTGTVYFAAGVTSQWVQLTLLDDAQYESNESFRVVLHDVSGLGALIGTPDTMVIDIVDNDPAPGVPYFLPISNQTAYVSNTLVVTVTAQDDNGDLISLSASNLPARAQFGAVSGYGPVTAELYFTPDELQAGQTFSPIVLAHDRDGIATQEVMIQVRDRVVTVSPSHTKISEDGLLASLTVALSRPLDAVVSFTVSGEASRDQDLVFSPSSLVFSVEGPAEQAIQIAALDDELSEGPEISLIQAEGDLLTVESPPIQLRVLDDDSFSIVAANLTSGANQQYQEPGIRILESLQPDIVAIQEFNVTYPGRHREFVDRHFGTNFYFFVEPDAPKFAIPNGIISRWPIRFAGIWDDPVMSNREFVCTAIDVPGGRDVHVISVHLDAGNDDAPSRAKQAQAITNYVKQAQYHPHDLVLLAGDLNTLSRSEQALATLTNVFSDQYQPSDQRGVKGTNKARNRPYDYILPIPYLNGRHMPVRFGGLTFPNGFVFDTRLWTNAMLPAPALVTDSATLDMQHMAVMKWFSLDSSITIMTRSGAGGRIEPVQADIPVGSNMVFQVEANPHFFVKQITVDGVTNNLDGTPSFSPYMWTNALSNGWLDAVFAPRMTSGRIPHWWLAGFGITNIPDEFDVELDADGDGYSYRQEFIAGTDPTASLSFFAVGTPASAEAPGSLIMQWPSTSNRVYRVLMSSNMMDGFTPLVSNIKATPPLNVFTVRADQISAPAFQVEAFLTDE